MNERDIKPLTPDLHSLLAAERNSPEPPAAVRERVRGRIQMTIGMMGALPAGGAGLAPATAAPATLPSGGAATTLSHGLWLKLGAGALVLAAGVGVFVAQGRHLRDHSSPALRIAAPPTAPVAPAMTRGNTPHAGIPAPTEIAPPGPASPIAARPHTRHPDASDPAPIVDDLAAERALLEHARLAIAGGRPDVALAVALRHARRYPQGQLIEERESLWIRALSDAGRGDEARARGEKFRAQHPGSIFLPAVDATLKTLP